MVLRVYGKILCQIARIVKKPDILGQVKRYMKGLYPTIVAIFKRYAAFDNVKTPFTIQWGDFTELMLDCKVADQRTCRVVVRNTHSQARSRRKCVLHARALAAGPGSHVHCYQRKGQPPTTSFPQPGSRVLPV